MLDLEKPTTANDLIWAWKYATEELERKRQTIYQAEDRLRQTTQDLRSLLFRLPRGEAIEACGICVRLTRSGELETFPVKSGFQVPIVADPCIGLDAGCPCEVCEADRTDRANGFMPSDSGQEADNDRAINAHEYGRGEC